MIAWQLTPQKFNSPTFLLIEKLTKDQADMNAASAPHVGIPARVLYGQVSP
jgi:hypothetical protein